MQTAILCLHNFTYNSTTLWRYRNNLIYLSKAQRADSRGTVLGEGTPHHQLGGLRECYKLSRSRVWGGSPANKSFSCVLEVPVRLPELVQAKFRGGQGHLTPTPIKSSYGDWCISSLGEDMAPLPLPPLNPPMVTGASQVWRGSWSPYRHPIKSTHGDWCISSLEGAMVPYSPPALSPPTVTGAYLYVAAC